MSPWFWIWQGSISVTVYITIKLNGRGWIHGWLIGFIAQVLQLGYGMITAQWGYLLAVLPGIAFLEVWLTKLRERRNNAERLSSKP